MTAQLQIGHQHPRISDVLESDKISEDKIIGTDRKVGVRQVGIWSDTDYTRHIWLLMDIAGDNTWKPYVHWSDKGQYTAIVRNLTSGTLKSPPPYRDYPYGDEHALMKIKLVGDSESLNVWCRQINAKESSKILDNGKVRKQKEKQVISTTTTTAAVISAAGGKMLWNSDDTLKTDAVRVAPGNYANDETNTILFASAIDWVKQNALFGINNGDAVWSGIDSRWYINHHILDSEVVDSSIEFNLLMGAADEIRIQLGNRSAIGWLFDNDYAFGGYEFIISADGRVWARIEYYYALNETGMKGSSYSLADKIGELKDFDPQMEMHVKTTIRNKGKDVLAMINIGGQAFQKIWKEKDWSLKEGEIPKGRVDSKQLVSLYQGVKQHWSVQRIRIGNQNDNGSLINKIRVYKL